MLTAAFWTLGAAVALGAAAAWPHLRAPAVGVGRWLPGAAHGSLAALGFVLLVLALPGASRGAAAGVAAFGPVAAALAGLALLAGLGMLVARLRRKRPPGALVGVHATLGVSGFVILLAYLFSG